MFGSVKLPVPILIPWRTCPRLELRQPQKADLDPVVLDQREVLEQPGQGQSRRRQTPVHLVGIQALGLLQQRRPLVVQKLLDCGPLGGGGLRVASLHRASFSCPATHHKWSLTPAQNARSGSPRNWVPGPGHVPPTVLPPANGDADLCTGMHRPNSYTSA